MNKSQCFVLVSMLLILVVPGPATSVVIRHDVPDESYRVAPGDFPFLGYLDDQVAMVLVEPRWALTAAHMVEDLDGFNEFAVRFGEARYEISGVVLHPRRQRFGVEPDWDLALLRLDRPVEGVVPVDLNPGDIEEGSAITLVGRGRTGNGVEGMVGERDGLLRRAENRILEARAEVLVIRFDAPPDGMPLEGAAAAKDSGSPFLARVRDRWSLVGISAASEPPSGPEGQLGQYGTLNHAARVDTKAEWFREVIDRGTDNSFPWGAARKVEPGSRWALTPAERHMEQWIQGVNAGDEQTVRRLVHDVYRLHGQSADEKVSELVDLSEEIAPLRVHAVRSAGAAHASILVWVERHQFWGSVTSCVDPSDLQCLQNVVLRNAPAPPSQ
jgi:hypothetical protein